MGSIPGGIHFLHFFLSFCCLFFFGSWALGPESLFPPHVACCLHPVLLIFIFYYLFVLFYLMLFNFIYLHIISISCFMFNNIKNTKNMSCHLFCLLFLQYKKCKKKCIVYVCLSPKKRENFSLTSRYDYFCVFYSFTTFWTLK
jgi:hypothetical protein